MKIRQANANVRRTSFIVQKKKGMMKQVGSFTQIYLMGHLFDSLAINDVLNTLETQDMQFNFVTWNVGRDQKNKSKICLQVYSKNAEKFDLAMNKLQEIAIKKNFEITFQM